jgi:hypothetical protein
MQIFFIFLFKYGTLAADESQEALLRIRIRMFFGLLDTDPSIIKQK